MSANSKSKPVALVTGAGKRTGIGFEICRQLVAKGFTVCLTARSIEAAKERAVELGGVNQGVSAHALDVTDENSVEHIRAFVEDTFGGLDVLINNAAASADYGEMAAGADLMVARDVFDASFFGAWALTKALLPMLRRSATGRIVNVSSGAGSHGDPMFGLTTGNSMGPSYSAAKAALNALTAVLANELRGETVLVNAVCPGFTATFEGGDAMGARPVAEGAAGIVWAATLPPNGPSGGFFRDGLPLPW